MELTKQDILELFAQSDRRFEERLAQEAAEREKSRKESDQRFAERLAQETERLAQEAAERGKSRKEWAEKLAQEAAEREKSRKELEKSLAKSQAKSLAKSQKAFDKRLGEITGTWSRFVQAMVEPNILKLFSQHGLDLTLSVSKVKQEKNGIPFYEIDLLLVNKTDIVAVEIKSTLQVADVDEHLARLEKIRAFPPNRFDFTGANLFGAVAGMIIAQNADKYAVKQGLYVLKQAGNTIKIVNDAAFVPRAWNVG